MSHLVQAYTIQLEDTPNLSYARGWEVGFEWMKVSLFIVDFNVALNKFGWNILNKCDNSQYPPIFIIL